MTNYGEKFLSLNNEREVIRDESLGKTYLKGKTLRLGMIVVSFTTPGSFILLYIFLKFKNVPYYFETGPTTHSGMLHNLVEKISSNLQFK